MTTPWEPAPVGEVLMPDWCGARDADGQGCTHGVVHLLRPHQSSGLRAWLEAGMERALIRAGGQPRHVARWASPGHVA